MGDMENAYEIVLVCVNGHRGRIILKNIIKEVWFKGMDWIQMACGGVWWQVYMNTFKILGFIKTELFNKLDSCQLHKMTIFVYLQEEIFW
jgi:hypothetical protein